jgi:WXG100 family type VII secretion target
MPSGFNVTAETLQSDANRIATGASNIEGHLAFLKNAVESVVNSGWVGVAAQSAAALHEKLDKAGRDVKESTTFFSQSTHQAATNYAQREDEVRSAFSGG